MAGDPARRARTRAAMSLLLERAAGFRMSIEARNGKG
jgi:hypothetical protein